MYLQLDGLKQYRYILIQFWKLHIQNQGVSKATLPLKTLGEGLPDFSQLPVVAGSPLASLGLWEHDSNLCLRLHPAILPLFMSLCPNFWLLVSIPGTELGSYLIHYDQIVSWSHRQRLYFQIRSHSWVWGIKTLTCLLGGHLNSQYNCSYKERAYNHLEDFPELQISRTMNVFTEPAHIFQIW